MVSERASQQAFFGMSALLFAASATVTIVWGNSHVRNGRHANARRLDDVDGLGKDAGTVVARGCSVVSWHVGCDQAYWRVLSSLLHHWY